MIDPLSDILSLLDVRAARCKRFEAGPPFAMRFPAKPALKFAAVLAGGCWIRLEGAEAVRLAAGDTFLLADAPPYILASDVTLAPEDGYAAYEGGRANGLHLRGADVRIVSGEFMIGSGSADMLLKAISPFVHVSAGTGFAAVLRDTLAMLDRELAGGEIGRALMARRMADIALVQILRAHAHEKKEKGGRWIGALTDRQIAVALQCIHERPDHRWTVAELASASGMSRSVFAKRFDDLVGSPPLEYLRRWRLERAREALLDRGKSVTAIALEAGYASESAFRNAFKRRFGLPPGRCRTRPTATHG